MTEAGEKGLEILGVTGREWPLNKTKHLEGKNIVKDTYMSHEDEMCRSEKRRLSPTSKISMVSNVLVLVLEIQRTRTCTSTEVLVNLVVN